MYLEEDVVKESLRTMASLTKGGGCIAASYLKKVNGKLLNSTLVSALGEPFRSAYTPKEIEDIAMECGGWETLHNSGMTDWHEKFCKDVYIPSSGLFERDLTERIWVGELKSSL